MNAHHQKRSYRHSLPSPVESLTMGSSLSAPCPGEKDSVPSGGKGKQKEVRAWKGIARVPFGYQLEVVVPSPAGASSNLPTELDELIQSQAGFQLVRGLNLADLLVPLFMNDYIRKGSLIALSIDPNDTGDVVCIDGRGRLILHLTKETYEVLGLPGRPSKFGALRHEFVVEIDLRDDAFRAGKKGFERTKKLLREWPGRTDLFDQLAGVTGRSAEQQGGGRTWDLLFAFVDQEGHPQPIAFPPPVHSTAHTPTFSAHQLNSIPLPPSPLLPPRPAPPLNKRPRTSLTLDPYSARALDEADEWDERVQASRDWLGLARIGAADKLREEKEGEEKGVRGDVTVARWEGFWHPTVARGVLGKAVAATSGSSPPPFVAVSLSVPPNAPISHLAANPVPATRRRPGSDSRGDAKRGRGTGEEDERDFGSAEVKGGWELVIESGGGWAFWEQQ